MANTAVFIGEQARISSRGRDYLGPARVVSIRSDDVVEVDIAGRGTVTATLALAFSYAPTLGDALLVIGGDGNYYGIGVLSGRGRATLTFPGDVDVRAEGGVLRLSGDKGVEIKGPELDVYVDKLRMMAGAVVQKFESLSQRVSSLFSLRAGQTHTVVEDTSFTKAKSAVLVAEETASINGKQVHLG
jgi:hypothetical protein